MNDADKIKVETAGFRTVVLTLPKGNCLNPFQTEAKVEYFVEDEPIGPNSVFLLDITTGKRSSRVCLGLQTNGEYLSAVDADALKKIISQEVVRAIRWHKAGADIKIEGLYAITE